MSGSTYQLYQQRLLAKRKQLRLSLQALADLSGVSKSIVSKIELGQVQPSIQTAALIAGGLGCSLSDMFQAEKAGRVIYHPVDQQFTLNNGNGAHTVKIISPSKKRACVEIFHEHLNKGEAINEITHLDAEKFILALDHQLNVKTNGSKYILNKGDCLHLERKVPHTISNKGKHRVSFITTVHRHDHW